MNAAALTGQFETFMASLAAWAAVAVPNILLSLLLVLAGWWLASRAERGIERLFDRQKRFDPTLITIVSSLVRYAILIVVFVAALGQLGVQTTSVLAALGAIGLAIGLALQGTLSNVAAGLMLIWLRPFKVGDNIETAALSGTVRSVGLFATELHSGDGVFLFVPNAQLWNTRVSNFSRLPTRMIDLRFGIAYRDDIAKARQALIDLAARDRRVRQDPQPQVFIDVLGDSAISIVLRIWAASSDYWNVRCEVLERGKAALENAGLSFPFPQRDVHLQPAPDDKIRAA
jgi:small conductance mechanosensitive channel